MRAIVLSLHNYYADYDSLPPPFVENDRGKKLYSWRVLILPYLADRYQSEADWLKARRYDDGFWDSFKVRSREKAARSKAEQIRNVLTGFDYSEPWDGPRNRRFTESPLEAFCCPDGPSDTMTDYLAVVGPETAWPEGTTRRFEEFQDGTSNTLLVVEVVDSEIHWSEPQDLRFDSMSFVVGDRSALAIRGPFQDTANGSFADGSTSSISADLEPDEVKAMLTIDGQDDAPW